MKKILPIIVSILLSTNIYSQFVDTETSENIKPENDLILKNWELVFSDEFNGTSVDESKWRIDNSTKSRNARPNIGVTDWRWKPENVSVENGNLVLKVFKTGASSMTNGSINSYTKYTKQYGYFEARIKVGDASKGTHTAFWLQGPNMSNVDGTANDGAEIDVFETAWTDDYTKSVIHRDGYGADHKANTKKYDTPGIHEGFHTWGFHWTEHFMDIYYDGVFKVRYSEDSWVVRSPEFLWLSNGASFGVSGDQYFKDFPIGYLTETHVDYIRVWHEKREPEVDPTLLSQDTWQLVSADSQDEVNPHLAVSAFDNDPYTFWFTQWSGSQPTHPHEIQIDLGSSAEISGFKYIPRQDSKKVGNVIDYKIYTTLELPNWDAEPIKIGTLTGESTLQSVDFDESVVCKYVKFVALSDKESTPYSNIAELYIKGSYKNVSIVDKRKAVNISVYPNPFENEINILWEITSGFTEYKIYSINGKMIKKGLIDIGSNELMINTSNINKGVYILEVLGDKIKAIQKIVK